MEVFNKILEIFLLGVIGGAVPGPMLTAVFTEVLSGGFVKSLRVVGRALFAETVVALVVLLAIFALDIPQLYFYILSILGSGYLIYLASKVWKINKIDNSNGEIFTLAKIFMLTILNGGFWIFWLTVCVPRAFSLDELIFGGRFIFLLVFELGWLLMTAGLGYIFSRFRPILLKQNLVATVFKIFATLLVLFALRSVYDSIIFIIN
ncbi:MAG: hypothetical protein A3J93_02710 [Candidatus Magasanikbacteria bacterium RIFOXYC2_FULL_42_28]|uniref:Lysine transporter LysE n=1 Tax=Candidatus Magasanikbacteria bacterium RIFOXYC2_FULL_42_28 TaxID=1798704 RepID=A0A1F6NVV5_9BACT|nr:MAG: hypothetical protein A3J93_02710 [Candidatus Magasanikbacteria bacterium RIFOXYC2_FULL_42_28]